MANSSDAQWWLLAVLIALLGIPHGALDAAIARNLLGTAGPIRWTLFSLSYLGLAALVVLAWAVAPMAFLVVFLLGSVMHFGGDLPKGSPWLTRVLYGGAIIVLPALLHSDELQRLLGMVSGPASAAQLAPLLAHLAAPWLGATLVAVALLTRHAPLAALELLALVVVAVAVPPLLAFTVYFCAMHSPRHILRTLAGLTPDETRAALSLAVWPTLAVLFAMFALVEFRAPVGAFVMQAGVLQVLFVGLAALTLPHMVLLEMARRATLSRR